VTSETNSSPTGAGEEGKGADLAPWEQLLLLAQKVEELEDRVRSLAVNDVDRLRTMVLSNQASITKLKSPRHWIRALLRRIRTRFGQRGTET